MAEEELYSEETSPQELVNEIESIPIAELILDAAWDEETEWDVFSEVGVEDPRDGSKLQVYLVASYGTRHVPRHYTVEPYTGVIMQSAHLVSLTERLHNELHPIDEEHVIWDPDGLLADNPPDVFREDHYERERPDRLFKHGAQE